MKFFEDRFKRLTFESLSQLNIAKCNELTDHLSYISDDDLLMPTNWPLKINVPRVRVFCVQRDMIRSSIERRLSEVIMIVVVSFQYGSKDTETAVKLETGVVFIINDQSLIPKPVLTDICTKRTNFNSNRKLADQNNRAFGTE